MTACAGLRTERVSRLPAPQAYTGPAQVLLLAAERPPSPVAGEPVIWVSGKGGAQVGAGVEPFCLPGQEISLIARLISATLDRRASYRMGIAGGCGGAGVSTMAVTLAAVAAAGTTPVRLIDADPSAGGIDLLVGAERASGLRWSDLVGCEGPIAGESLERCLPQVNRVRLLSFDRSGTSPDPRQYRSVLSALASQDGFTVVDLGRLVHELALTTLPFLDSVLLLTPGRLSALAGCMALLSRLPMDQGVQVVVRDPRWGGGLSPKGIARAIGVPLAGCYRSQRRVARSVELGEPPWRRGSLPRLCRRLIAAGVAAGVR